jgi:hypothetical protein
MTEGSHHLIVFMTQNALQPDGTLVKDCGLTGGGGLGGLPIWTYSAQTPEQTAPMPDGVGMTVNANQHLYVQMHYLNTTDEPLVVHASLSAFGLPSTTEFTRTEVFVTFNADISIPPHATNFVVTATCDVADKKFWQMSTHAHMQAIKTSVADGTDMLFTSDNWEHPGQQLWDGPRYYQFKQPQITWSCTYNNTGANADNTIVAGQSARTDEMCMAVGYQFPAVGPRGCFKSGGQCRCLL